MADTWNLFESEADFDELFPTAVLEVLKEVKIKPGDARKNLLLQELLKIEEKRLSRKSKSVSDSEDVWDERLRESMKELEIQKGTERTYRIMKKLSPFMDSLKSLMQICESLVQDAPFGVSIAFTGLRVVLSLAFDVPNQLDIIIEALGEAGDMLQFCQRLIKYDSDPYFQKLLVRSYKDIIWFWIKASKALSENSLKTIAKNVFTPLRIIIKEALDKLRNHSNGLKDYAFSTGLLRADQTLKEATLDKRKKQKDDLALWIRGNDNLDIDDDVTEQLERRHGGTCKWILEEEVFRNWRDATSGSVLWYHAPPGSGKSVLAASTIDYLRKRNEKVGAFFYSYSNDTKRYGLNGLRSLALQLLSMTHDIPDRAIQLFEEKKIYNTTLRSRPIATDLIHQLLSPLDHVYLIVDGLDECPKNEELLADLSDLVQRKVYATVKWLFLSRKNESFRSTMSEMGALELRPKSDVINMDIQTYVTSTLTCENCFAKWSDDNEQNFLYARFVCETLRGNGTLRDGDIESALEQFPRSLTSYYARSIEEIARRSSYEQKLARMAFIVLVAAQQSITFGELMDALSVNLESHNHQRSRLRRPDEILNLCGPLITLERRNEDHIETHIVKFYHKTLKDFLLQDPDMLKIESIDARRYFVTAEDAQREIGTLCLSYLMDQQYSECRDLDQLVKSVDKDKDHAFLRYAATFWCQHLSEAKPTTKVVEQVTQFLKSKAFWTCIGVQSHTAPHLFGTYIPLKSRSYRMSSKAYKWNGKDAYGLPLPDWLDAESTECTSLVRSLCCFTQEWNEVITNHTASIGLCGLLRHFDMSCHLKPLSKNARRPKIDHLSDLTDLTGHSDVRILDIKFHRKKLSAKFLFRKVNEEESRLHNLEAEVSGKILHTSSHDIPLSGDKCSWDLNEIEGRGLEAWSVDPQNLAVRTTTSMHSKHFKNPLVANSDFAAFKGGEWTFLRAVTEYSKSQDQSVRILHVGWLEKDQPLKCQRPTTDETEDEMTDDSESEAGTDTEVESDSDADSTSDRSDSVDGYESMTTDSSVDDEDKRTGQCIIVLQPQNDPYWTKPWMNSAMRWDKVGCAIHPNLPLLAFTHTSLEIELVNLEKRTQQTKYLPEPVNINGKPASSTRELRFSACGKYLHCLMITFMNAPGQTNCQVTVATYSFDPNGSNDSAFLKVRPPLQCTYSFADKLSDVALPLTLTYWTEDSLLISLPPLTCDAKIIHVNLPKIGVYDDTGIKTLREPIYFPSSTPHRDPRLLQRTSSNSDEKDMYLHLALGALFPPKRETSLEQQRPEAQDGTRIGRPMDQASPPVFLRWKISQDDGWRSWDADLDSKSSDLKRETPVWEVLRGDYVDPNKPFSVPIRFGLDWTRKGYLSC